MAPTFPPLRLSPHEKMAEMVRRLDRVLDDLDAMSLSVAAAHVSAAADILRARLQSGD